MNMCVEYNTCKERVAHSHDNDVKHELFAGCGHALDHHAQACGVRFLASEHSKTGSYTMF